MLIKESIHKNRGWEQIIYFYKPTINDYKYFIIYFILIVRKINYYFFYENLLNKIYNFFIFLIRKIF